jgi:DNA-binding Lrp family transcriptional regulator
MLHRSEYEVEQDIKKLEKDKIILSYNTLINWEKFGTDTVHGRHRNQSDAAA